MMYKLCGISHTILKDLHDWFMPYTIITGMVFNKETSLYDVTISSKFDVNLLINKGNIFNRNERYNFTIIRY